MKMHVFTKKICRIFCQFKKSSYLCNRKREKHSPKASQAHPGTHPHRIRGGWRGAVCRGTLSLAGGTRRRRRKRSAHRIRQSSGRGRPGIRGRKGLSGHLYGRTHRILCRHYGGDGVRGRLCRSLSPKAKISAVRLEKCAKQR